MKRIIICLLGAVSGLVAVPAAAQQSSMQFGGLMFSHDLMLAEDFASLSRPANFGTARAMALGGAFTSLGADMSAMSINPAGLGMYRRSEISLTPMLSVAQGETANTLPWQGNNRTRFSFANVGAALNIFESSSGSLVSMTLGVGLNRVADFNTRYSYSSESVYDAASGQTVPTLADVFSQQLTYHGIFPNQDGALGYDYVPYFWPAILGYNGFMTSQAGDQMVPDMIGHNASAIHSVDVVNSGSINEFQIALGANINNILYVGATLGIQSVHKKTGITYQEQYLYDGAPVDRDGTPLASKLDYASLYQQTVLDGSGLNFKIGAIVRPVAGLRLGVAYHTPTFYSLDRTYAADIESSISNAANTSREINTDRTPVLSDDGPNSWEFVSPSRLLFGASYTFGTFAIVSVDYERDWYNGIRVKNVPDGQPGFIIQPEEYKLEFKNNFCATNAVRAGLELKPLPVLALRVGGGYTSSMLKDKSLYFNRPVATESHYLTAGIGFTLSRTTVLDLAYQYAVDSYSKYQLFFSMDADAGQPVTWSGFYDTSITRHYIALTLGFRF
jgi:hypothetical protein